jgi:hypothetical protein
MLSVGKRLEAYQFVEEAVYHFGGFPMSNRYARLLKHVQWLLLLVVPVLLVIAAPAYAEDTGDEAFEDLDDDDALVYPGDTPCSRAVPVRRDDRLLRVKSCGYTNPNGTSERGRVEMVTYRLTSAGRWLAVTSQSISLMNAYARDRTTDNINPFGQFAEIPPGGTPCRHGSPGGPLGCSVPNTHKGTFYRSAWDRHAGHDMETRVFAVAWRDDRGEAHFEWDLEVVSPPWEAREYYYLDGSPKALGRSSKLPARK